MILRRRGDTFERVIREHLGGALFARGGNVDAYFNKKSIVEHGDSVADSMDIIIERTLAELRREKRQRRIEEHIRTAPEREAAALRRAKAAR